MVYGLKKHHGHWFDHDGGGRWLGYDGTPHWRDRDDARDWLRDALRAWASR